MNVDSSKSATPSATAQRVVRYKEKFQALREKYEQVMSTHEQYERELAVANKKLEELQNECNLLLDAVDIAVPGQPTLQQYLNYDPVPPQLASAPSTYVLPSALSGSQLSPAQEQSITVPPGPSPPSVPSASTSYTPSTSTNGVNGH